MFLTGVEALKVFVLLLVLINGLVAMLSLSFFTVICYVLYKEFEYLCRTFIMKVCICMLYNPPDKIISKVGYT